MAIVLRKRNEEKFFKYIAKVGRCYKFSESDYVYKDVQKVAGLYGLKVQYNPPGTGLYDLFGCFNFTIVAKIREEKKEEQPKPPEKPLIFDINELVI